MKAADRRPAAQDVMLGHTGRDSHSGRAAALDASEAKPS